MSGDYAFVIMQVGQKGSPERRRADEVYRFVVTPALETVGLAPYRADLDATPGPINPQMLRKLLEARVVIADLTGRNPNVFYELGIVHSFARPVVSMADRAQLLPFDAHDERVIELGDHKDSLGVTQAEEGRVALTRALEIVLQADYVPNSPVAEVAARRSLDQLAPKNPIAAELTSIRQTLSVISMQLRQDRRYTGRWLANAAAQQVPGQQTLQDWAFEAALQSMENADREHLLTIARAFGKVLSASADRPPDRSQEGSSEGESES
jgi:hypothetical protein